MDTFSRRGAAEVALSLVSAPSPAPPTGCPRPRAGVQEASAAVAEAGERHACELAEAAAGGNPATSNPTRKARTALEDAEHELAAATSALAKVKARLGDLEDEARAAAAMVTVAADMVVRSHASEVLMEAEALAARLRGLRCILCFMERPEVSASDTLSTPRPDPLSKDWQFAVRQYGKDRADRRARDAWKAQRARDEGFAETKAEVRKFLSGGVLGDERRNADASVAPWQAARAALMDDADAPLPALP
jgi:hypothetical protein